MKLYLRVISYIKSYRIMVILSLLSSFIYVGLNAISIWMISSLIPTIMNFKSNSKSNIQENITFHDKLEMLTNRLIGDGNQMEQLKMLCIFLFITFIFKNVFFYINNISIAFVQNRMIMDIRNQLFIHLQKLPLSFFNKSKSGELSSIIMNDVASMRAAFTQTIKSLINEPINILVLLSMLFIISVKLTLFVLITVPISAYIIIKLGQSVRRKTTRSSISIAGLMNILQENLNGIRIVKSFVREKFEIDRFLEENKKYVSLCFKLDNINNLTIPINDLIGISLGVLLIWVGSREVFINQTLSPDGFMRFIIYLFAMLQPARRLGSVNAQIQTGLASAMRVFSIIDVKSDIHESSNALKIKKLNKAIEFKNVSFQYENSHKSSLKNISISIPKGNILALVGSSGAGKTTIVDLIPRFYDVTKGKILIDDIDIRQFSIENLRQLMGIVSQDTILFNDTIINNIRYGSPMSNKNEVEFAANAANATDFINNLPDGYQTVIGEKGVTLSGGQRQRLSIARAILKNPDILILDEATSSLDTESEQKVQAAIDNLIKDRTVIVIAHRLSTIIKANQILVLDQGEIVEEGNHQELILLNGRYKQLYNFQSGEINF